MAVKIPGEKPSGIKGIVGGHTTVGPSSYRSAESAQQETRAFFQGTLDNTFENFYTVTAGKTFYVTTIIFSSIDSAASNTSELGISSATILKIINPIRENVTINLITPMKFTSGQVIQVKFEDGSTQTVTLIGWEE